MKTNRDQSTEKLAFGELELSILKIVREKGRATVRTVYESLGSQGSYTTIMTVMGRMADKGELMRTRKGKQYVYWISSERPLHSRSLLKRIQNRLFGGKAAAMVSYLLEIDGELSEKDLQEIEEAIQKRKSESTNHG